MNIVGQNHGRLPLLESLLSVVGRATREEDSFGSYRKNLKRLFPRRRTGEGAIDGIVGIGVLAALEKGELTCEAASCLAKVFFCCLWICLLLQEPICSKMITEDLP